MSEASSMIEGSEQVMPARFQGIDRLTYWVVMIGLLGSQWLLAPFVAGFFGIETSPSVLHWFSVINALAAGVATALRLRNIGYSLWWMVGVIVLPVLVTAAVIPCAMAPAEYARTQKLDRAGKILITIAFALVGFLIIAMIISSLQIFLSQVF